MGQKEEGGLLERLCFVNGLAKVFLILPLTLEVFLFVIDNTSMNIFMILIYMQDYFS